MALCGGVSCIIEPRVFAALRKAKMISPGGTSKPFSSQADGYGRGEGCGVVLLKPLEKVAQFCLQLFHNFDRGKVASLQFYTQFLFQRPLKTTTKFGASSARQQSTKTVALSHQSPGRLRLNNRSSCKDSTQTLT